MFYIFSRQNSETFDISLTFQSIFPINHRKVINFQKQSFFLAHAVDILSIEINLQ